MRAAADIARATPLDFGQFLVAHAREFAFADAGQRDHVLVAHGHRPLAVDHRAHGELGLKGHADLAHQQEVERRIERGGNLRGHRHAAARQRQHHRLLVFVTRKCLGEPAAGIDAIDEGHGGYPLWLCRCVTNQRAASSITASMAPGSGKRCVAPGTISSFFSPASRA